MSAISIEPNPTPTQGMPAPLLRTLAVCDLADSTALTEQLGDRGAAELVHKLDRRTRDLLYRHSGREIDKTDGFLVMFERPIQAVAFAIAYQRLLREVQEQEHVPLQARIGIHVGDVVLWENSMDDVARGAKAIEVEGLVKPVAARLMSLALPGQILLSGVAYTFALRAQSELDSSRPLPEWRAHGRYLFKGVAEPMAVVEVGEKGIAPLHRPAYTGKAHREVPWWRRPGILVLEAALLVAAVVVPAYISMRSPPAIAFANRDWIVVGDLNNLTGQAILDDSLDAAFRVSIEQSRYVNLVSVLQVNDALQRMQKAPGTRIDRATGAEIALREGARALVLPSVAEIGGRVRVTAEVIDPHTQSTVYVETADGVGLESILPSVGKVSDDLRGKLGEALGAIAANNAPLPKVTTANLDALRAYALNLKAYDEGRWADALNLLDQAIKVDPGFALAYMGKASIHISANDNLAAKKDLDQAETLRQRLPPRDLLRLDAMQATLLDPAVALEKWKVMGTLYPDAYIAPYCFALIAWTQTNDYGLAIEELKKGLSPHNRNLADFHYFLGVLQLATDSSDQALASFETAKKLHVSGLGLKVAEAYGVRRQFDKAMKIVADSKVTGVASNDLAQSRIAVTLPADRGQLNEALAESKAATRIAETVGSIYGSRFNTTTLSVQSFIANHEEFGQQLRAFVESESARLKQTNDIDRASVVFHVLFGAYLGANQGDLQLAERAISVARIYAHDSTSPSLKNLFLVAEAETQRANGRAAEAIALLQAQLRGTEPYLTHIALRDAYVAADRDAEALDESVWLAQHRGRAYEEYNDEQALQAFYVIESDLALLSQAELATKLGRHAQAEQALHEFLLAWPNAKNLAFVSQRLELQTKP
jgi:putative peptide modification system cyclase